MIKISILKNEDKYAYMEYQGGNDPKVFNDTYGSGWFWDLADVLESVFKNYEGMEIVLTNNLIGDTKVGKNKD